MSEVPVLEKFIEIMSAAIIAWGFAFDGSKVLAAVHDMLGEMDEVQIKCLMMFLEVVEELGEAYLDDTDYTAVYEFATRHTYVLGYLMRISPDWVEHIFAGELEEL